MAELLAEAEDHQQRVVDRNAEADERDEELDDDRDIGDVGQRPDEVKVVRIDVAAISSGIEDRGQRPEDEQQDDQRADAADQRPR